MSKSDSNSQILAWIKLARVQFYMVPALAVISGAILAARICAYSFDFLPVLLTIIGVWLVLFITVVTNEIYDLPTDKINANAGAFTGGSRVLVDQILTEQAVRKARRIAMYLLVVLVAATATLRPERGWALFGLLIAGLFLGIGYTAPPLKLVYRGCGEIAVAISQGALVLLAGFVAQGGDWQSSIIWNYALPLSFAIMPSIILGGFPDKEADSAVGKRTLVVRMGTQTSLLIAAACTICAVATHFWFHHEYSSAFSFGMLLHAMLLLIRLLKLFGRFRGGSLNGSIAIALSFVLWFVFAPLMSMLR